VSAPPEYTCLDKRYTLVRDAIQFLLLETDDEGLGLSYEYIRVCMLANFQRCQTTVGSVRKEASRLRLSGIKFPQRRKGLAENRLPVWVDILS
jgi:hypothetical protein